jgi:peptide deformylase
VSQTDPCAGVLIGPPGLLRTLSPGTLGAVGIVALDALLSAPDFRGGERAFAVLWSAAEAVSPRGRVIAQTLHPGHYAVDAVRQQSRARFYGPELEFRAELGYPPFRRLCVVSALGKSEADARAAIGDCRAAAAGVPGLVVYPAVATFDGSREAQSTMAVLSVRRYGDPVLRQVAKPVAAVTPDIETLIADMTETMWRQVGIGLAAPQIGVSLRIFVMDNGKAGVRAFINPIVTDRGGAVREEEGCLSVPGVFADVERSKWLTIDALGADGERVTFEAHGLEAKIIQHEISPGRRAVHRPPAAGDARPRQEEDPEGRARATAPIPPRLRAVGTRSAPRSRAPGGRRPRPERRPFESRSKRCARCA